MPKLISRDILIKDFRFWRYLTNTWSILFFLVAIADFITNNACRKVIDVIATMYIAILAIYASDKEFERWYNRHRSQHPGEIFVILWTILIFFLVISSFIFQKAYEVPGPVISSYIAVLTILAITRRSKVLYKYKHRK